MNFTDEQRFNWLCVEWHNANQINTYQEWARVRTSIYGAVQAIIFTSSNFDVYKDFDFLQSIAHQRTIDAIYEDNENREAA